MSTYRNDEFVIYIDGLRRARLLLRLSCGWASADFADAGECREAPSGCTGQAMGCGVKEMARATRSIREVKALVVDARTAGRTNARAESVDKKTEDVKRRSCGFTKCENMRRRLLLAFGRPPLQEGGVPLPNRNERQAAAVRSARCPGGSPLI